MLSLCLSAALFAQDAGTTFRAEVNWVRVDLEVLLGNTPVPGLTGADFILKDNGKPVEILKVLREEAFLDLVLLFDMSGSMERGVAEVAAAAKEALAHLRQGDRVAVAGFNDRLFLILPFSEDLKEVEQAIRFGVVPQPFRGSTELHESVMRSAALLSRVEDTGRRRAILVITDNQGEKGVSDDDVTNRLWKTDTVLCGLLLEPEGRRRNRPGVEKPAARSGCELREALNPRQDFAAMMARLRNRYVVYYSMPQGSPGERRDIDVSLARETRQRLGQARVLARKGYFLPGAVE